MKIGITGHQKLDDVMDWSWVTDTINRELDLIAPPIVAVTSLAIGADQLLARLVRSRGGKILAIFPYADLERSFSPENLLEFLELKTGASVEILNTPGTDEDAYLAAGKRVADLSDILVAVWNGLPAKGKGGTADVVAYALDRKIPVTHINPSSELFVVTLVPEGRSCERFPFPQA